MQRAAPSRPMRAPLRHQELEASLIGTASGSYSEQALAMTPGHAGYAAGLTGSMLRRVPTSQPGKPCTACPQHLRDAVFGSAGGTQQVALAALDISGRHQASHSTLRCA